MISIDNLLNREMREYKSAVTNKARPEGSIAEAHVMNECLTFCSMYLRRVETKFTRPQRNIDVDEILTDGLSVFSNVARPYGKKDFRMLTPQETDDMHWYVLNNCEEVEAYIM